MVASNGKGKSKLSDPRYRGLKPAKPGEVRNPKGNNGGGLDMWRSANKLLSMPAEELAKFKPETVADLIEYAAALAARNGDMAAHRELRQLTIGDRLTVATDEPFDTEFNVQRETALADLAARSTDDRDDSGENGSHRSGP